MPGVHYKWSAALVPDPEDRSKDLVASAALERIASPDALRAQLAQADAAAVPALYAEAGLWYDVLTTLSELIEADPQDTGLRRQRVALLEQGGVREIALDPVAQDLPKVR